jgi:hypothetical protein
LVKVQNESEILPDDNSNQKHFQAAHEGKKSMSAKIVGKYVIIGNLLVSTFQAMYVRVTSNVKNAIKNAHPKKVIRNTFVLGVVLMKEKKFHADNVENC